MQRHNNPRGNVKRKVVQCVRPKENSGDRSALERVGSMSKQNGQRCKLSLGGGEVVADGPHVIQPVIVPRLAVEGRQRPVHLGLRKILHLGESHRRGRAPRLSFLGPVRKGLGNK